ncbi:SLATT domain-containing protein [Thalassomonas actiniarum]|uniref:SLATT domain-containing protein n=2 Tax=Thalassomonas actiniarum TaxID=485447 RepID=A0AAE9YVV2_9GAMM|nr:SLATT domain-containing protein [Thalassomonas actiniarum]
MIDNIEQQNLLLDWYRRFRVNEKAHYKSATACRIFNYTLGIPLVIITTIVASDIFELFREHAEDQFPWKTGIMGMEAYLVSILSVAAPVLAALQTFLRFPERAEKHKIAGVKFGLLKKDIEKCLMFPASEDEAKKQIEKIKEHDAQAMLEAPSLGAISLFLTRYAIKENSTIKHFKANTENAE